MHLDKDYVLSSRRTADMEYAAFSSSLFRHVLPAMHPRSDQPEHQIDVHKIHQKASFRYWETMRKLIKTR
jgi:hypothetical protein